MSIKIGSNIASLQAQRRLGEATGSLSQIYERLSSGQRINKAVDDAAGLAIGTYLNAQSRIMTQALRNVNDGLSLLNIGSSALSSLEDITLRQRELAEQSANGVYSSKQREAMSNEVSKLTDEYNRIISTTSFNGTKLLDDPARTISIQAGNSGSNSTLDLQLGSSLALTTTTITNEGGGSIIAGTSFAISAAADYRVWFSVDGMGSDPGLGGTAVQVSLTSANKGDPVQIAALVASALEGTGDFSTSSPSNGQLLVTSNFPGPVTNAQDTDSGVVITTIQEGSYDITRSFNISAVQDYYVWFNIDGHGSDPGGQGTGLEVALSNPSYNDPDAVRDAVISVLNGTGEFSASISGSGVLSYQAQTFSNVTDASDVNTGISVTIDLQGSSGGQYYGSGFDVGDFNGDGYTDLFTIGGAGFSVFLNDGAANFTAYDVTAPAGTFHIADFNNDGQSDIYDSAGGSSAVYLSNGDGTFNSVGAPADIPLGFGSFGGSGNVGFITLESGATSLTYYSGNGDGTFTYNSQYLSTNYGNFESGDSFTVGRFDGIADSTNIDLFTYKADGTFVVSTNGGGTFYQIYSGYNPNLTGFATGDVDGDGADDIAAIDTSTGDIFLLLPIFGTGSEVMAGLSNIDNVSIKDFDNDGKAEILAMGGENLYIYSYSTTTGTFTLTDTETVTGGSFVPKTGNFNADTNLDVVTMNSSASPSPILWSGDGNYGLTNSSLSLFSQQETGQIDFNSSSFGNDTAEISLLDFNSLPGTVFTSVTTETTYIEDLDISTAGSALTALDTLAARSSRISEERGKIGAFQSRLGIATNTISAQRENFEAASARIMSADIAEESSRLLRFQILQQSAASILAQANQTPALALTLLNA